MTVSDIWEAYRALRAENKELKREIERLSALELGGTTAQGLPETDPRRRALSDATRKAQAEAKVRQHYGYEPEPCRHHNDGYNTCTYCGADMRATQPASDE